MRLMLILLAACGTDAAPPIVPPDDAALDSTVVDAPTDGPAALNGCTPALAIDLTDAMADRKITMNDDHYTPPCPRILVGQAILWVGDFNKHPLSAGIIRPPDIESQPGNPIPTVTDGGAYSVTFDTPGDWAFYCPSHAPAMAGVVYVVP